MQLTQFTDYSLRALIYIALRKNSCTIKDITETYSILNAIKQHLPYRALQLLFQEQWRGYRTSFGKTYPRKNGKISRAHKQFYHWCPNSNTPTAKYL